MTKKLLVILLAAGAALGAWGETYEAPDGKVWAYYVGNGMATILGVDSASGTLNIPSTITDDAASYPVEGISSCAFENLTGVSAVTIPASVTSIGWGAFYGCTGLRSVSIPVSVKTVGASAFQNCTSLEQVALPVSISKIEQNTFYGCTSLRSVEIPVTITSIGSSAFYGCLSLSSLKVPFSVKSIESRAFYGCNALSSLELSEGLESLGYEVFYGCSALREVVIPSSVTSISDNAFAACGNVRSVTIPPCMLQYYHALHSVFGDVCKGITSVTLHEGCEWISAGDFYDFSGLVSVTIPASVRYVSSDGFSGCTSLENITVASGNPDYRFSNGLLLTKDGKSIVAVPPGRTWVTIPDTVIDVWCSVFSNCHKLDFNWSDNGIKSIDGWIVGYDGGALPSKLTLNGYRGVAGGVFSGEPGLTSVTMGEGMKAIGADAFAECANLSSVSMPASVTTIGEAAFYQTFRLKSIMLAGGNRSYKYSGGLLASADDTQLVAVSRDVTSVKIPEGVAYIPDGFFAGCTKLTSVTIPKSLEDIDESVFAGWEEVETDDDWTYKFHGCPALKTITVMAGNPYWKSVSGMLLGIDNDYEDVAYYLKAVPQSLTSVTIPEGVRWISDYAFAGCAKLTSITLPRSLDECAAEDFYVYDEDEVDESGGPYNLTSIKVAAGNEEYSSANGLLLSADGTEIYCVPRGLTSVTIPASVTDADFDFEHCTKLKSFSVENGSKAFSAVNGMLLTKDGKELVCVPSALKSQRTIAIPAGITRIGSWAFSGFDQLTSIVVPEGVVEIGRSAFSGCESLAKVALPTTVEKIGDGAFYGCRSLLPLKIPDSVGMIGADAFVIPVKGSCCGLRLDYDFDVGIYDTNSIPGFVLVDGWLVNVLDSFGIDEHGGKDSSTYSEYLNEALADPHLRGIASGAFSGDDARLLRSVILPPCVKYVGDSLFANCSSLEWVDIPEGVVGIGQDAFRSCRNLSGVTIPDSVRCVAQNAFQNCSLIDRDSIPGLEIVDGWILKDDNLSWYLSQDESFAGELVISGEQGIRGVADFAFAGSGRNECCGLSQATGLGGVTSLIVGDGVVGIGTQAFALCNDLVNVYVSASVKYIGEKAFYDCQRLQSVQLPDTLKGMLPDSVFAKCPESLRITYYEAPRPAHEVRFDPNFDDGECCCREVEEGRAIGELPEISRDQYRFLGWFTDPEGGEKVSATTLMGEDDVTFWAHWKDMSEIDCHGPFIVGSKVEINVELVNYAVSGLPSGLRYDPKTGKVSGVAKTAGEFEATFMKKDADEVAVMFVVREEEVSVGCVGLDGGTFTAGVAGNVDGIPLEIDTETGVKSVAVTKLPAGMKYDAKTGLITGAPSKAGDYTITLAVTTQSGAKKAETITISVAALPDNAVGTFNGFVKAADGEENLGAFQLAATDAGKLTAKVTTAAGTYSFSGTCWDKMEDGVYSATMTTKKGETLTLELDSSAGWNKNQLTGSFTAAEGRSPYPIVARKNAFGKTWYFTAVAGRPPYPDGEGGWTLSYAENEKVSNLTVTLNADGSTKIAGKLVDAQERVPPVSVSASGYADVTGLANGVIFADFAPVVSVKEGKATLKKTLSIRANLWFDRSNDHADGVGTARIVE